MWVSRFLLDVGVAVFAVFVAVFAAVFALVSNLSEATHLKRPKMGLIVPKLGLL
jgi:hypothetical protein